MSPRYLSSESESSPKIGALHQRGIRRRAPRGRDGTSNRGRVAWGGGHPPPAEAFAPGPRLAECNVFRERFCDTSAEKWRCWSHSHAIGLRIVSEGLAVSGLRIPPTWLALRFSAWAPGDRGYRQLTKSTKSSSSFPTHSDCREPQEQLFFIQRL